MAQQHPARIILLVLAFLIIASLACSLPFVDSPGPSREEAGGDRGDPQANLACERQGYPCTIGELSEDVLEKNKELMAASMAMLAEGASLADVAEELESDSRVVSVRHDDFALAFRIEGSLPMWVFNPKQMGDLKGAPDLAREGKTAPYPAEDEPEGPAGPQPPGMEPGKQALILSPYLWQFESDETEFIAGTLESHRNYDCAGCVELHQQTQKPPLDPNHPLGALDRLGESLRLYTTWEEYEIIHISTHGGQACPGDIPVSGEAGSKAFVDLSGEKSVTKGGCSTGILTGNFWFEAMLDALEPGDIGPDHPLATPGVSFAVLGSRPGMGLVGDFVLTDDFFSHAYPQGLDDKILFFSACKSFQDRGFMDSLVGENTTYFGWDDNVNVFAAEEISEKFYDYLINEGFPARTAYQKTLDYGGYQRGFAGAGADLLGGGYPQVRGREVITMLHPASRTPLSEGATTVTGSRSVVNDLEDDRILFTARVEGLDSSQDPADYEVHVSVDGIEVDETFTPSIPLDESTYLAQGIVPLGTDVDNEKVVTLETWIDLPGGGETRHHLEVVKPLACGWHGRFTGPMAGDYSGLISDYVQVFNSMGSALNLSGRSGGMIPEPTAEQVKNFPPKSTWLLSFNRPDDMMGAIFSSYQGMSMGMLMPPEEQQTGYVSENIDYRVTKETERVIQGEFSGKFYGIKVSGGSFSQVEGPEVTGEFTWHAETQCNMDIALQLVDNFQGTYPGLP